MMLVAELFKHLSRANCASAEKVVISVVSGGAVGPSPTVGIESVHQGIDWNKGQLILQPLKPLTILPIETIEEILSFKRRQADWSSYQEYKRMKGRIAELEAGRAEDVALIKSQTARIRELECEIDSLNDDMREEL